MRTTARRLAGWCLRAAGRSLLTAVWSRPGAARSEAVAYFSIGRQPLDTRQLRAILPAVGYPPPQASSIGWGGGGYGRLGRRMLGGAGSGGGGTQRRRRFRTNSGFGSGHMFTGYASYDSERWRVFPFVGIGGGGQGFGVRPAQGKPTPLQEATLPAGGTGGPEIHAGWTTEYRLRLIPQGGLLVGVQLGWTLTPLRLPWFVRGFGDVRLPLPRAARPYVNLVIGAYVDKV